jgi:hypothetical protein
VEDGVGDTEEMPFTITINAAVNITTTSLPNGIQGEPYSQQMTLTGGTAPISWSDKDGGLVGTGLAISSGGLVSGTPASAGPMIFIARAVDTAGSQDEQVLSITVEPPYLCGDADNSDLVNIADLVYLVAYIFNSGPAPIPPASGDANCTPPVNIADVVYLIAYIFSGGPAPCAGCP